MARAFKLLGAALAVLALYVLFVQSRAGIRFVAWADQPGGLGVAGFAVAYVVFTVLLLPGSALTLGAGFLYGPLWGTLLVSPVSVLGATLAFLLARSWAREWVQSRLERSPRFLAIDRAVAEREWVTVFLLRLSPLLPFNLLNYALGLSEVRLSSFVSASFLGMLPGTFLYVYLGSLARSVAELARGGPSDAGQARQWFFWAGLVVTLVLSLVIARASRRALQKTLAGPR